MINTSVDLMMRTTMNLLGKQGAAAPIVMIKDGIEGDEDHEDEAHAADPSTRE
jgi:hypothetical protein